MYGIPLEPARILLKYTLITTSGNFAVHQDTKLLIVNGCGGASGGGSNENGVSSVNGGIGGQSSFGIIIFPAVSAVGQGAIIATGVGAGGSQIGIVAPGATGVDINGGAGANSAFGTGGLSNGGVGGFGAGGGGGGGIAAYFGGGGGGSSYIHAPVTIINPVPNYTVVIGAGGIGGIGGGANGGAGGGGVIQVLEYT